LGTTTPRHNSALISIPCSRAVGTSGKNGSRAPLIATSARTLPAFTSPASAPGSCTTASTCPPSRLGTTCAALKGTSTTSKPAALNSHTELKWVWLPNPELPMVSVPGFAFACCRMSRRDFHGASLRTNSRGVSIWTRATGRNDL
jgi:hypothetical protein